MDKMERPVKVSVIIPVYNVEQHLPKCLASVVQQTLKDIEIICVNDGSTDNSLNILKEYALNDNRIKIINSSHIGLSCARNKGLEIATGEYIGFVDSDDYIDENFFELLYNEAKGNDVHIACCGIKREDDDRTRPFFNYSHTIITNDVYEKINLSEAVRFSFVWNKIYKHSFIKENDLKFMDGVVFEDIIFTTQVVLKSDTLVTVPNTFYHYVKREKSISLDTVDLNVKADKLFALKFMCEYYEDAGIDIDKIPTLSDIYNGVKNEKVIRPKQIVTKKVERVKLDNSFKISVIIPVYNSEKYIAQCLESVINQPLKDIEIICVNDGSTDTSLDILNEYALKDNRIKIISQAHTFRGAGSARNRGIETATGEYISFVDSDDYIEKDFLQNLYETAKEYNADVACSGVVRETENENIIQLKFNEIKVSDKPDDNLKVSKSLPFPYPWNKIYKREFIVSYDIKYVEDTYYEDLIFTPFVITKAEKLISVPDVFYHYIERENSVTTSSSAIKNSDKERAFNLGRKYYNEAGINI